MEGEAAGIELAHEVLHLLDRLQLEPFVRSRHYLTGRHLSPLAGRSPDFKEYAEYKGQSASEVDWRASAKGDRLKIRIHEHTGMIRSWLVLDGSASMLFGEKHSKWRLQLLLAGLFSQLLSGGGDPLGLLLSTSSEQMISHKPTRTREGLAELIRQIATHVPVDSDTGVLPSLRHLASTLKHPSWIWVISDFDRNSEEVMDLCRTFLQAGHDLRILHLYHPLEWSLDFHGSCKFEDLEGEEEDLMFQAEDLQTSYRQVVEEHLQGLESLGKKSALAYIRLDSTASIQSHLSRLFGMENG